MNKTTKKQEKQSPTIKAYRKWEADFRKYLDAMHDLKYATTEIEKTKAQAQIKKWDVKAKVSDQAWHDACEAARLAASK